jgi:hypothetical protein
MNFKKAILILVAALFVCSAQLLQVTPVSASADVTNEQGVSLQAPPPAHPHPPPPPPPPPPPRWSTPPLYSYLPWYPGGVWPYPWRWSNYMATRVVIVERPQQQPVYAPVINSFTANPGYIQYGQSVVLTWTVSNASTVTLSPAIGSVPNSGSYNVSPGYTTTYTLSATNSAGSVSASTTVTVAPVVSTFGFSSGAEMTSAATVANTGQTSVLTLGLGGNDASANSRLLYILLIGLLALAAVGVIVFLVRRPAAAAAGNRAGTRAGYLPWSTATRVQGDLPHTTPVDIGPGPKFVTSDGGHVPMSGNAGSLGRSDFRSLVKSDKADLISREHIRFDNEDGDHYIEDRSSTNGTKVNGTRISGQGRFLLSDGDIIELADALTITFKA